MTSVLQHLLKVFKMSVQKIISENIYSINQLHLIIYSQKLSSEELNWQVSVIHLYYTFLRVLKILFLSLSNKNRRM